jgi:hypothetical protein
MAEPATAKKCRWRPSSRISRCDVLHWPGANRFGGTEISAEADRVSPARPPVGVTFRRKRCVHAEARHCLLASAGQHWLVMSPFT